MTLLTKTYLGNSLQDAELNSRLAEAQGQNLGLSLNLDPVDCVKGRIYAHTNSGEQVGIIKDRSWEMRDGDVFLMETGQWLVVHVRMAESIVACFSPAEVGDPQWNPAETALALVQLGHCLGNHHWPMLIEQNQIVILLTAQNRGVFEALLHEIDLPGLRVTYETRSLEPERIVTSDQGFQVDSHVHARHHL
jgi:urease accessory protein